MTSQHYEFGPFRLDKRTGVLLRDNEPVAVGRRGLRLLAAMLERRGEVMSKGELIDAGWGDQPVEEGNLSVQIGQLRKALGTEADDQQWISTVARVGYRFAGAAAASYRQEARLPTLAVLPFANLSGDTAQDYLADGFVEDLTTAFARFKSLVVLSRNSAFRFKGEVGDIREVSKLLGAGYLVEGSVRRVGDKLRITAQLIEGTTAGHLWADNFDGELRDVFDVQDRIVDSVVAIAEPSIKAAEIQRSRRERPDSLDAWDLFLRGTAALKSNGQADTAEAIRMLEAALVLEPHNGQFLAALASALQHGVSMGWPSAGPEQIKRLIDVSHHGLQVVNNDAEAMALFGLGLVDSKQSEVGLAALQRAFEVNPNSMMAVNCLGIGTVHLGSLDDAEGYFRRAVRLNPDDPEIRYALTGLAHVEMIRGNFESALRWAERSLTITEGFGATS